MSASFTTRGSTALRRAVLGACAAVSTLFLAACDPAAMGGASSGPATGQMITPGQPVRLALLVPGGTGSADLDWLARSLRNSARMAAADAPSGTIDLRVYDAGNAPAMAVAQANAAADAGAQIILGPLFADSTNAVGSAMMARNINVLSLSNNSQVAGGNVFTLGTDFDTVADRLVRYGVSQGKRNFLVVAEDDVAGQLGGRAIEAAIARANARIAARLNHPVSISGIDAAAPRIAQAATSGQVDAIFMTANNQAVLPYLTERLAGSGVSARTVQMMGLTRWDQPADRLRMPQLAGGWFALPDQALMSQFEARYTQAYGEAPHPLAFLAYDGTAAIASLARSGRRDALTTTGLTQPAGFAGVGGVFRFNRDGTSSRALAIATIRDGRVVIIDPAPRSSRGLGS
ncbi:MAG: penicillin-binding protein activator [Paracoccus sp. (in: a-proteobacteria)]|nr:penicillin-binding protein activator [Paracoccus sp. (in: a-proteobacteria)]